MWLLVAKIFLWLGQIEGGKTPSFPGMMMMVMRTRNTTENSLSFVSAWVARYGSFAWSARALFQMHKPSMLIIQRNVQKLYLCYSILERQIYTQLHIPILCSKHLTLFGVLCRPQALSRGPIFIHRYASLMSSVTLPTLRTHGKKGKMLPVTGYCCRTESWALSMILDDFLHFTKMTGK